MNMPMNHQLLENLGIFCIVERLYSCQKNIFGMKFVYFLVGLSSEHCIPFI